MYDEHENSATTASHGDAQSDIMSGGLITVMAMFFAVAVLIAPLLLLIVELQQKIHTEQQKNEQMRAVVAKSTGQTLTEAQIEAIAKYDTVQKQLQAEQKQTEQLTKQLAKAKAAATESQNAKVLKEDAEFYKQLAEKRNKELAEAEARAAKAEQSNPQEVQERLKNTETALAQAEARAAKAEHQVKQRAGNMISSGLRLWKPSYDTPFITDAKPIEGGKYWMKRYTCRVDVEKVSSGGNAEGFDLGK